MRLSSKSIDEKLYTPVNRYFSTNTNRGIIQYGSDNLYPQAFEKLILSSQTAKACANMMANFIAGDDFANPELGNIVVGYDNNYNKITLNRLRYIIAQSLAMYNGVFIHCNKNAMNEVSDIKVLPFKNCRLQTPDDYGYSGAVAVSSDWAKIWKKDKVKWYANFSLNDKVTENEIINAGGIQNWNGQIYHFFKDDYYSYPLSPFDSVEFEMNTEQLVQVYKNREVANGFNSKTVVYVPRANSDEEYNDMARDILDFTGPDGAKELIVECDFDANGELVKNGYHFEQLKSNIDPDMFNEQYQKSITNNIRKAAQGMPAVLIDYSNEALGQVSGEAIAQSYQYYNAMTKDYRDSLRDIMQTIFSKTIIKGLEGDIDFEILPKKFE